MRRHRSVVAVSLMAALGLSALAAPAFSVEKSGKVMGVFHEKVKVNTSWMDKVSVTIRPCDGSAPLATYHYSPTIISDENVSGHLFNHLVTGARHSETKTQFMNSVNGHVTLNVTDQDQILKTTFWGHNWECGQDLDHGGSSSTSSPGVTPGASTSTPAATTQPARKPVRPRFGLPGLGF